MSRKWMRILLLAAVILVPMMTAVVVGHAWTPVMVTDDPLVRMPGTQPGQVTLEGPNRCLNCHSGYDQTAEPGFNWQGSMMAQASRDFLFWSAMTVAAQDSIWAVGRPNATDICLRCHFPKGWLEGRSDPTNAINMTGDDYDGLQCDFCHRMVDPFFEETHAGTREGNDWLNYWDETNASTTPSLAAANATLLADRALTSTIQLFNGNPFYQNNRPFSSNYIESTSGQYFISNSTDKRASFADANAVHSMQYSRFHKSKYFCATCHDVSNPILANLSYANAAPGDGTTILPSESEPAYSYFHAERTFSEFMLSDYGQPGGAPGIGPYDPTQFNTSTANNYIAKCQDCHMPDVVGAGADKKAAVVRPTGSTEHPNSGQPQHDMTGGNIWVSYVLASTVSSSSNYDATNDSLLNQGAGVLTLDLTEGQGLNAAALLDGVNRAKGQLTSAGSIQNLAYDDSSGDLSFRVQNQTAHKLISGFPEGRRMFVNVKAYAGGSLIYEINPYDTISGTIKGLPSGLPLGTNEAYVDQLVYEVHPSSSLTGETETFHFALADDRYKDNRIPPKGFNIISATARLAQPRWHGVDAPGYFTAAEYAGGYDDITLSDFGITIPGADAIEVDLYYQTTSREYIEFLRDETKGSGNLTLIGNGAGGDPPYIIQTDPYFNQLKAWGDTIWNLWTHNKDVPGAAPFLMTQSKLASWIGPTNGDWHNSSNWAGNTVPDDATIVHVRSGSIQLSADAEAGQLIVSSGATVDLAAYDLTVEGLVLNGGSLKQTKTVDNNTVSFLHITDKTGANTKYRGVEISTTNNLAAVTVTVRGIDTGAGEYCTVAGGTSPPYADRCYSIVATGAGGATVTLWALGSEAPGINESDLAIFRHNAGSWQKLLVGGNPVNGNDGGSYVFAQGDTPGFSDFLLGDGNNGPTTITLRGVQTRSDKRPLMFIGLFALMAGLGLIWLKRISPNRSPDG